MPTRDYSRTWIDNQIAKTIFISRPETLKQGPKVKMNLILFLTTFNRTLSPLDEITNNLWDIWKVKANLKYIFQEPGILTNHRPNNFREMIGSNNILNNNVIHRKPYNKIHKILTTLQNQEQSVLQIPQINHIIYSFHN